MSLAWLDTARGVRMYEGDDDQDDVIHGRSQRDEQEEKQQQHQQEGETHNRQQSYSLTRKPSTSAIAEFHSAFLHDLYGVRTSLSESRRHQAALLEKQYKEVIPRPEGRAVNLGVDLPDSIPGRTVRQKRVQHRRQRTAEDVGQEWNRQIYAQPTYVPPNPYARPNNTPYGNPSPSVAASTGSASARSQTRPSSAIRHAPNIASALAAAHPPTLARPSTASSVRGSPSPHSQGRFIGMPAPPSATGAWTARPAPPAPQAQSARSGNMARMTLPLNTAPSGAGSFAAWPSDHAQTPVAQQYNFLGTVPPDAHPSYPIGEKVYVLRPGANQYTQQHPHTFHGRDTATAAGSSNSANAGFIPLRQIFVAQPRPSSAVTPASGNGGTGALRIDVSSPRPHPPPASLNATSTALVVSHAPSAPVPQTASSAPSTKLVVHPADHVDLTDPYTQQAHAILCSLLKPENMPLGVPYVHHLPIETVLATPQGKGNTSTTTTALNKVSQTGPPVSRLIDLHLGLEQMQTLAAQFDGLPCVILGRKIEPKALCGVRVDSFHVGPGTPFPQLTLARTKERLLSFLSQITHQHRQELHAEIATLPALILWFIHYDQAAEIVVRLAELGVRARVVHMEREQSGSKLAAGTNIPTQQHDQALITTNNSNQPVILPRRTFTFYSLHLSSVSTYSFPILRILSHILRAKVIPNFIFLPTAEEKEEHKWMQERAAVLRGTQDVHMVLRPAHAKDSGVSTAATIFNKTGPQDMLPGTLTRPAPMTITASQQKDPNSATGLTPHELNSLPRRQQKSALRKEILLILNQKAYMQSKKEQLIIDKHKAELVKLALEGEIKTIDLRAEKHLSKMQTESQALAERIRLAKERKEREDTLIAAEKEVLSTREAATVSREAVIQATQEEIASHFALIENEKVEVLSELDLIEEELQGLSLAKRDVMDQLEQLDKDRSSDASERARMASQSEKIHQLEQHALEEKSRLESESERLKQEHVSLTNMVASVNAEKEALQRERESIEASYTQLEQDRLKAQQQHEQAKAELQRESEEIKQADLQMKQSIKEEQDVLAKKIQELRSVENHIYLSKNLDAETEKLEMERREILDSRKKLESDRIKLETELAAERKKIEEEYQSELAKRQAEIQAKEQELEILERDRVDAWNKKMADEKAQREFEEKERLEKAAAERAERYKMKRESKMQGKSLQISTDTASLKARSSISSIGGLASMSGTGLASQSGGLLGVDENGNQLIPGSARLPAEPMTPIQKSQAAFDATMSVKKLVMTADDIAALTPAEKRKFEKEQSNHAEWDEMYRQYLGISYKHIRKSGPPPVYLWLDLSVEKIEKVSLVNGCMPVIEVHNLRGKTSSHVEETEHGTKDTLRFLPLLLDVSKICALQLERPILFKCMQFQRDADEPRVLIGETQMNLVELQSHKTVPFINLKKQSVEGKKYTDAGKLHIHQAELFIQSTYGLTHHPSCNTKDPSNPTYEKLTKCVIRFEAKGTNLTMGGGFFGASKDVAPFLEFKRKEHETGVWATQPFYKSEFRVGTNVIFTPVRFTFFDACYNDLNRPILCQLKHDSNLGKDDLINEFEFTMGELLGVETKEFPAGAADKKGVRSGKIIFSKVHSYSALTDLGALCEAAGLQPQPVAKSKENADLPPLGLDSMMVENQGRIATAAANPQPIAFGHWIEPVTAPVAVATVTPTKPIVVARKSVMTPDAGTQSTSGRKPSVASPQEPLSATASMKVHKKASSTGPEKGTLSQKKKKTDG